MLKGKLLSILGDSISTYKDVSNDKTANALLVYNPFYYRDPFPLEKTYWKRVMDQFGMELCVNNSWSGGNLSGRYDPDSGVNRACHLSRDYGASPDFIIVFMGINDLGRRVDSSVFASDYLQALLTIKEKHPHADVCCVNLPDRDIYLKARTEIFNAEIQKAAEAAGEKFFVADLFSSRLNNDYYYLHSFDGLHPHEEGMKVIAEVVAEAITAHFGKA